MRKRRPITTGMKYFHRPAVTIFSICIALFLSPTVQAQVSTASINGAVRDSSGAVIPGVSIVLHNMATGVERTTVTNATGDYVLLSIPPGLYRLGASKQGFAPAERSNITLSVNQTASFDFTLSVGSVTQAVTVRASAVSVEASTAELGTAIMPRQVNELPLNGRNFTQLLALTPGVSTLNTSQNTGFLVGPVGSFTVPAINGQGNRGNLFLFDGINNLESMTSSYAVQPIVDDLQEFKVDSHNDQAEFGGVMGGVVNLVTKSGTNEFHGALWEFMRNTSLDARSPFLKKVTPYTQNQFGGNVGGPVVLPHYNGRDKTFFFFGIEQFINHTAGQTLFVDPTSAQWNGDFSALSYPIYNPFTTRPDRNNPGKYLRDPFQNNQIPTNLLDPHTLVYRPLYPPPVETGVAGINGLANTPTVQDALGYDVRVDQQVGGHDSFWFRFSRFREVTGSKTVFIGGESTNVYPAYNLGANWVHNFSPSAILQAQFGRVNVYQVVSTNIAGAPDIAAGFSPGFACGFGPPAKSCEIPGIGFSSGYAGAGEGFGLNYGSDTYLGKANLSLIRGKHTLEIGGEMDSNNNAGNLADQNIGFTPFETSNLAAPGKSGDDFASFLLGVPNSATRRNRLNKLRGGWVDSVYFQDMWKATSRLTVNLGVRYDVTLLPVLQPTSTNSQMSGGLDFSNGTYTITKAAGTLGSCAVLGQAPCIPDGVLPAHVVVGSSNVLRDNSYNNVQPRIGLAYRLNDKTAIRASFGMFTDNWAAMVQGSQNFGGLWPNIVLQRGNNLNPTLPTRTAEDPLGTGGKSAVLPAATPFNQVAFYVDPHSRNPYSQQWNLGVQRQFGSDTLLSVDYVGSHSLALPCCGFYNTAVAPGPAVPQSRARYSYIAPTWYQMSQGSATYNALQVSVNKTANQGLTYLISYTWSKAMNAGCDGYFGVEGCSNQNPYNIWADKSLAGFDLTHRLSASWVYRLPFGPGQRWATGNRVLDHVIGPWSFNGIATLRSGAPYTVTYAGDVANTGNIVQRVNLVGNPTLTNPTPARWIDTTAFQAAATYTWGNIGRNTLRADWGRGVDLSIFREFAITESKRLEFRAEAFNFTNTPIFAVPTAVFNSSTFGKVTGTASTPRQVQLALKFYY